MVRKTPWTQRVKPKDKDFLDQFFDAYQEERGLDTKGEALVHFVRNRAKIEEPVDRDVLTPEIYYPQDRDFEQTCPFGYLKKIISSYGQEKWHCLKHIGPEKKGKPVILADGQDKQSIKAICEICQLNWQVKPSNMDQARMVFEKLGEKQITSKIYFCTRDALGEGIKFSNIIKGRFYCIERGRKVTIEKTCIANACPFLIEHTINLGLGETLPFVESQKALELIP